MDKKKLDKLKSLKKNAKKDKTFEKLTQKEKDELLKAICLMLNLIKE